MPGAADQQTVDPIALAKNRIVIGPVPDWTVTLPYDVTAAAKTGERATFLLDSRQVHAERRQVHVRRVTRLETMLAVEQASQWRIPFDPQTETLTVHWIRTKRVNEEREHANIEHFRVLQREEALESLIVSGQVTLLLLLDDVRPGDILDACYTLERHPQIMPGHLYAVFDLIPG